MGSQNFQCTKFKNMERRDNIQSDNDRRAFMRGKLTVVRLHATIHQMDERSIFLIKCYASLQFRKKLPAGPEVTQ